MDYELAVQLKEAGFPIKKHLITRYKRDVAVPTLEELIDACGEDLSALNQISKQEWFVSSISQGNGVVFSTPIEAVARLWLALHSK
jgi:hypothetical protein